MFLLSSLLIHLRRATTWNVAIPLLFVAVLLTQSISPKSLQQKPVIRRLLTLLNTAAVVVTIDIFVLFYAIYVFHFELINPPGLQHGWMQTHVPHVLPMVAMLVYNRWFWRARKDRCGVSLLAKLLVAFALVTLYFAYIHFTYFSAPLRVRWWPYPFMNNLDTLGWITLYGGSLALTCATTWISLYITNETTPRRGEKNRRYRGILPHLTSVLAFERAIGADEERVVVIRFGHNTDPACVMMDELLASITDSVKTFAALYVVDTTEVPNYNSTYELDDPCTVMFFFRNRHIRIDLGTGNNNKINWPLSNKQEMIDIMETVYRGAKKGRSLVISPKDYSTEYKH